MKHFLSFFETPTVCLTQMLAKHSLSGLVLECLTRCVNSDVLHVDVNILKKLGADIKRSFLGSLGPVGLSCWMHFCGRKPQVLTL